MKPPISKIPALVLHYGYDNWTRTQCGVAVDSSARRRIKPLMSSDRSDVDCKRCLVSLGSAERGANSY